MDRIIEAQAKHRPGQIKVLFVGESPPVNGYFYSGGNALLDEMRRSLGEEHCKDEDFLVNFRKRGWYLDDLVQTPVSDRTELGKKLGRTELRKKLKEKRLAARDSLAARIRDYKPSVIVCLLLIIREDVEVAALKADSDAPVYAVPFAPQQRRGFREKMLLLRPRLEQLPCSN